MKRPEPQLRTRCGLARVALVGDRGLLASARIREAVQPAGLDRISALCAPASSGMLQLSLFAELDLAEIQHPDFPGERPLACRHPLLATERVRQRETLLQAAERDLGTVLAVRDRIGLRMGQAIN